MKAGGKGPDEAQEIGSTVMPEHSWAASLIESSVLFFPLFPAPSTFHHLLPLPLPAIVPAPAPDGRRRLMHPPPPSEKERYFLFVVPRYDVVLEDVVANKHLPPLALQDFEDYLKYVEGTSQNLYFFLWLQRYKIMYEDWVSTVLPTVPSTSTGGYRPRDLWERLNPCQDRILKEEFASAKKHWLNYDALARLDISDDLRRSVLDIPNLPPPHKAGADELTHQLPSFPHQPSPSHFDTLLGYITSCLRSALTRFLRIAFSNGGLWHACMGQMGSVMLFLAPGLAMWTLGLCGRRRALILGSLPLIWLGFSLMLMSMNKHCFAVYATGDARQLYPHEIIRPLPPQYSNAPPVYSLDLPREADDQTPPSVYESRLSRKASGVLSIMSGVTGGMKLGQRGSGHGGALGIFSRKDEEEDAIEKGMAIELDAHRKLESREGNFKPALPPARKTKDLTRQSLAPEIQPVILPPHPSPYPAPKDVERYLTVTTTADIPEFRMFSEQDDFGIIVSDAYEEDEDSPFPPIHSRHVQTISVHEHDQSAPASSGLEPLVPNHLQAPEPPSPDLDPMSSAPISAPPRRGALPDIFSFQSLSTPTAVPKPTRSPISPTLEWVMSQAAHRGSKQLDPESREEVALMNPRWRTIFGPMTLVHDPLVRRAHWAITVRSAIVGAVVVCGMSLGLIR